MAESTKVRLVRCPKCENLLPELADYSVYQCGGCGAVLRAKAKDQDTETLSEKPDDERVAGVMANLNDSPEKGIADMSIVSDTDVKSNSVSLSCDEKRPEGNDVGYADEFRNRSKAASGKWVVENGPEVNINRDDLDSAVEGEHGDLNPQIGYLRRSGEMSGWQQGETGEMERFQRIMRTEVEGMRFSTSNDPDEGPSNYNLDSCYSYGEMLRNRDNQDGAHRVQYLEKDRADLLRKLDELKEQLNRSSDMADPSKEKVPLNGSMAPPDPYVGSDTWFPGSSSMSDRATLQFFAPDKHSTGPPYFNHHLEPFPCSNGHEMAMHNFHPSIRKSNHIPRYGDAFGSQLLKRAPHQLPSQYQQPPHQYFSGYYFDANPDPFEPHPFNATFHQPSCSCFQCYEKHQGVLAPVPLTAFHNKRYPDVSKNPMLYHHENPGAFGSHVNNSRTTIPPLNFHGLQSYSRWPSDVNPKPGGFVCCRPRRVAQCFRPIAGGAPFLTCFSCFELLQLPKKMLLMAKNQQKLRCGACFTVIDFAVVNKKLVISINTESMQIPTEVNDGSNEMINTSYSRGHTNRINENFSSDDFDNSGYDFQTVDTDPTVSSSGQGLNSINPQEMQSFHSSSPSITEDENSPDVLLAPGQIINSVQQPIKATPTPPTSGSPLERHFDYSSNNNVVNRLGKGNRSSRSDQEKVITNKATTRQNSMKEASVATEMEVCFHDYSNTGVSQDSTDASREDSQSKTSRGSESFFTNIIKKSFKDFSRSNQADERRRNNVSVNGHLMPDRLVKKAEKLAGPIHPGQYWYDFRAGFWGIMGGPCLGIIPPFIEELNHSMPENCAGGNTGVFVNGRELHQKDLDLLAARGLPTESDRSYIIEISGRVLDEDTGEELDNLGKLAPTVERVGHGFGMKGPKVAA